MPVDKDLLFDEAAEKGVIARWGVAFMQDMDGESARGSALVGAAELDSLLLLGLQRSLFDGEKNGTKWFEYRGPFDTFSTRIEFAYAIGMIGPETRRHLNTVRRIRNEFAHRRDVNSFELPRMRDWCATLCDWPTAPLGQSSRGRYRGAVAVLMLSVLHGAHKRAPMEPGPDLDPANTLELAAAKRAATTGTPAAEPEPRDV